MPTGGGKTFASLAFALHHAHRHRGLRRVVVAIPFTSIIEQTAEEYRKALGPLANLGLIEHHSNLDPKRDTRANNLAAENWDAPLVVTTNVQLYESLFAAKTTPCRKLHRLAGSVIILDEAQTLPVELLAPTLAALKELVARYGCTVVLCTATQPALEHRPRDFEVGLAGVRPIVDDVNSLHAALKRVEVSRLGVLADEQLVERLAAERAALCVVNTRPHAAGLFDKLVSRLGSANGCYHLSTFMCAQHRRDALAEIRRRLKDGKPCRLVSTQLIEAGVDVDFPAVYRAPAGFDSIAQAAGRCNREGNLKGEDGRPATGRVYLFDTEAPPPPGMLRQSAEKARELSDAHPDPLTPPAVEAYFRLFYWSRQHEWDKHGVLPHFGYPHPPGLPPFMYRQAADAYRIIREEQTPILVPYTKEGRADARRAADGPAGRLRVPPRRPAVHRLRARAAPPQARRAAGDRATRIGPVGVGQRWRVLGGEGDVAGGGRIGGRVASDLDGRVCDVVNRISNCGGVRPAGTRRLRVPTRPERSLRPRTAPQIDRGFPRANARSRLRKNQAVDREMRTRSPR